MYMKYLDFETWEKEHKDINNNLAIPSYRAFCKAYEINFHFGDETKDFDSNKRSAILIDEMPLHGKALSLFNFVNKPYHPFREGLVSFAYTSWDDFEYKTFDLDEIADMIEKKDEIIKKLKKESLIYGVMVLVPSILLTGIVAVKIVDLDIFATMVFIATVSLLAAIPNAIYSRKKKSEQRKFDQKLLALKQELKNISDKHESHKR